MLSQKPAARSQQLIFKDREDNASQLNRLVVAYFLLVYFRFQLLVTKLGLVFTKLVGAQCQRVILSATQVLVVSRILSSASVQVLTKD